MNDLAVRHVDELTIRRAEPGDLHRLLELYGTLATPGDPELSPTRARQTLDAIEALPGYRIYLAEEGTSVVGTCSIITLPNLAHGGACVGVVENVVVAAEARGRGVGRALMDFARKRCREAGCYKLMLTSNRAREVAHRFYDALGYERSGYAFTVTP